MENRPSCGRLAYHERENRRSPDSFHKFRYCRFLMVAPFLTVDKRFLALGHLSSFLLIHTSVGRAWTMVYLGVEHSSSEE